MLRALAKQLVNHGRRLFDGVLQRGEQGLRANPRNKDLTRVPEQHQQGDTGHVRVYLKADVIRPAGRSSWVHKLQGTSGKTLTQELRTKAGDLLRGSSRSSAQSLMARSEELATGRKLLGLFAFVGFGLKNSEQQEIELDDEQFEHICDEIKSLMDPNGNRTNDSSFEEVRLSDFNIGPMIAKGSNSAVYSASLRVPESESVETDSSFSNISENTDSDISILDTGREWATRSDIEAWDVGALPEQTEGILDPLDILEDATMDLALKMMFNYEIESDSEALVYAMRNETVPAQLSTDTETKFLSRLRNRNSLKHLEPHPNVVDIKSVFVDEVPTLPEAMKHYPHALPARLNPEGFGHNKTMFLVMKRYDLTLREYLAKHNPSLEESLFLFAQLLEAMVHLEEQQVAHRDLKSDNVLVDGSNLDLVVSDFGCCLADKDLGFKIPYTSVYIDRGGNGALMAPEILCAEPGRGVTLDYSRSDLWTVGTLAYELFGCWNPFYRNSAGQRLDSRSYSEADLPPLPDFVPSAIQRLVKAMLSRDPAQRPTASSAANVVQVYLWAPECWVSGQVPGKLSMTRWLLLEAAGVMCYRSWTVQTDPLLSLKQCFLARISVEELSSAVLAISNAE